MRKRRDAICVIVLHPSTAYLSYTYIYIFFCALRKSGIISRGSIRAVFGVASTAMWRVSLFGCEESQVLPRNPKGKIYTGLAKSRLINIKKN